MMPNKAILLVYSATLILSAYLLFSIQFVFSKMMLPYLGGSASVWNTSMVFFQSLLLLGYAYAHGSTILLDARRQAWLHTCLLGACMIFLPVSLPQVMDLPADANPALWQMGVMAVALGAPFFVLSASAPIIQRWFSATGHPDASHPYFLYAASNIGSMAALISYPLIIEPFITLRGQTIDWMYGYIVLVGLVIACAIAIRPQQAAGNKDNGAQQAQAEEKPSAATKLTWVILAFIPSSLMMGLTTYITTDIASAPMIWVVPLALYLLTFIIAFARRQIVSMDRIMSVFAGCFMLYAFCMVSTMLTGLPSFAFIPMALFFAAALLCHRKLALMEPPARYVTSFYMYLSLGGVIGGIFNALIAPVIFKTYLEFSLVLCGAVAVHAIIIHIKAADGRRLKDLCRDFAKPPFLFFGVLALILMMASIRMESMVIHLLAGAFAVTALIKTRRLPLPYLFLGVAMIMSTSPINILLEKNLVHIERNFFGIVRIKDSKLTRNLFHGTTIHGMQPLNREISLQPLSYYNPKGALGDAFREIPQTGEQKIAVIGLGAGSIACFYRPGRSYDFFEIDPAIVRIAENPDYFTFLQDCASPYRAIVGDGRLMIAKEPDRTYDMVIIDAFSSDNIPVHLMTLDAFHTYAAKAKDDGLVLYHISNRSIDLEPVLKAIARDSGYTGLVRFNPSIPVSADPRLRYSTALYAALTKNPETIADLKESGWEEMQGDDDDRVWTDDYANVVAAFDMFGSTSDRFARRYKKPGNEDDKK